MQYLWNAFACYRVIYHRGERREEIKRRLKNRETTLHVSENAEISVDKFLCRSPVRKISSPTEEE